MQYLLDQLNCENLESSFARGSRGSGLLSLEVSSPLAQRAHFPFPPKAEDCVSLAGAETLKMKQEARAEQRCLASEGPGSRAS